MNSKLQAKFRKRFKFMKRRKDLGTPYPMFGIETGDGWFDLLWKLCLVIEKNMPRQFTVAQIKEKFGTLRFYTYGGNDTVDELVALAEEDSSVICEDCGKPGRMRIVSGWYRVQCTKCLKAWKKAVEEDKVK